MDHSKILKRALSMTWNYRVLWVFGFLLALTLPNSGGGGSPGGGSGGGSSNGGPGVPFQFPSISGQVLNTLITAGILLLCVIFLLAIAATVLRYLSETSLMRLVDQHEETGEKAGVREGFRLGWSRRAFRVFLIDFLVGVVGVVAFLLLLLVAASPLLVWFVNIDWLRALGTVTAIGLVFLVILFFILVAIILSVVMEFIRRAAVLEDLGVFDSIRRGFVLVRGRLGDIVIMALILFALSLAWTVVMIPIFILLVLAGIVLGGLPALLAGFLANLFTQGATPWIVGALVGVPIFLLVLVVPGGFLSGLAQVFKSSAWTLTYREVLVLGGPLPEPPAPPSDELAG